MILDASSVRVLIVEDELVLASSLERKLESFGYEVVGLAQTAVEAIELGARKRPDLVLMDVSLPGDMDGARAALILRRDFDIPSVFVTGRSDRKTIERCKQASPLGYLTKPYNATLEVTLMMALKQLELIRSRDSAYRQRDEANARAASILRNCVDGIIGLGPAGEVLLFNQRAEGMFGRDRGSVLGKPLSAFLIERGPERQEHTVSEAVVLSRPRWRYRVARGDGTHVPIDLTVSRNARGEDPAYTVIARDVTEHERLEQQFVVAQKMEAVARLSSHVAHDFNNLLLALRANFYLLRDLIDVRGLSELENCDGALEQGAVLTRSLLSITAPTRRELRTVDLCKEAEEAAEVGARLLPKRVRLEVDCPPYPIEVRLGAGELMQVIMNLVINARDALPPPGGRIDLRVEIIGADSCQVVVEDDGLGMPPEVARQAFDPFFTTKPPGLGTGLGLPSVRQIVAAAGGSVHVGARPGGGTRVTVWLPQDRAAMDTSWEAVGRNQHVSVACEDERVSRWLARILNDSGYQPLVASSSEETLGHIRTGLTEMVVTDLSCWLGRRARTLQTEVSAAKLRGGALLLSSHCRPPQLAGLRYLEKPISERALLREVRMALV